MPVVVPQHGAVTRLGLQPHLGAARPQANAMPEDAHPAQARIDPRTSSHDPFGYMGFRLFIPGTFLVRAAEQDLLAVREDVRDPGRLLVPGRSERR